MVEECVRSTRNILTLSGEDDLVRGSLLLGGPALSGCFPQSQLSVPRAVIGPFLAGAGRPLTFLHKASQMYG